MGHVRKSVSKLQIEFGIDTSLLPKSKESSICLTAVGDLLGEPKCSKGFLIIKELFNSWSWIIFSKRIIQVVSIVYGRL